ncbi:hypothetical protein RM545_08280 [Zunongwangia sp. F260]|uniref:Uncharacterized protein n=1 Tax=Autumnicola lenta TaxID=3075593 RepID=A0ABU3CK02_9FLAO|nr:hypothetical protein [Zunongwangia sp. F260]MDT0646684.1 hypothetical protein [Zunongwangia sp. F260]
MKIAVTLLILTGFLFSTQAQVIHLEETEITAQNNTIPIDFKGGNEFVIAEEYDNQFEMDAIGFVCRNFKMKEYLSTNLMGDFDSYQVNFKSRKGFLRAHYNSKGDLVKTSQRFTDMSLPYEVRNEIFGKYEGWDVTRSTFIARGTGEKIDKGYYKIIVKNDDQKQRLKIYSTNTSVKRSSDALAVN